MLRAQIRLPLHHVRGDYEISVGSVAEHWMVDRLCTVVDPTHQPRAGFDECVCRQLRGNRLGAGPRSAERNHHDGPAEDSSVVSHSAWGDSSRVNRRVAGRRYLSPALHLGERRMRGAVVPRDVRGGAIGDIA